MISILPAMRVPCAVNRPAYSTLSGSCRGRRSSISSCRLGGADRRTCVCIAMTASVRVSRNCSVRQYMKPNSATRNTANMPATATVQRNVVLRMKSSGRMEDETQAPHIVDHRRLGWLIDLTSQPAHMHIDQVRLRDEFVIKDVFQQHNASQ